MTDKQLDCALDLMRRLPPQHIEKNLCNLIDLIPDLTADLLSTVDQPLKIARDSIEGKDFLLCDYNRDGDSYRSPWSNTYFPPFEDGTVLSDKLRQLEVDCNDAFDRYREMYFEGGVSSVYLWDLDNGFAGVIAIKKAGSGGGKQKISASWDSIHVIEVTTERDVSGEMNLGGSLTRQSENDWPLSDYNSHVGNIGRTVEALENSMRRLLNEVYFDLTMHFANTLRSSQSLSEIEKKRQEQSKVVGSLNQGNS